MAGKKYQYKHLNYSNSCHYNPAEPPIYVKNSIFSELNKGSGSVHGPSSNYDIGENWVEKEAIHM